MTDKQALARASGPGEARLRRWLRRGVVALAVAYPVALLVVVALLRWVGERWWVTDVALFLPRIGFALPWPVLVLALVALRLWRLLATQVVALVMILFPL